MKGGKRRAPTRTRRTVATVVISTLVAVAMVSGLSMAYFYRHLTGNLTVLEGGAALGDRVEKFDTGGPKEPLNILVMGSDSRDGEGNDIDGLTGGGERSDTTILVHLSADREHAYGISIPRDSMVDRPECLDDNGDQLSPEADNQMWNAAFALGGPACTIRQVEATTGVSVDHFVVVDFNGFKGMVDALGGVEVCIPETWDDPAHDIYLEEGTRKISGKEALNYVRVRYGIGDGTDLGRLKRQQAFVGSMAHQVLSSDTLANPVKVTRFLSAVTDSLAVDEGISNVTRMGKLAYEFRNIGLDRIKFLTVPWMWDPEDPNRVIWAPEAKRVWQKIKRDQPLPARLTGDAISVNTLPGTEEAKPATDGASPKGGGDEDSSESTEPSDESAETESGDGNGSAEEKATPEGTSSDGPSEEEIAELESAGLCV
ncbi:LCP family protein [Nocardioides insulae]|uniref:LCP family protein n=1 Tax=Nocardioides insulae TaxID=394734 RepID=UPI001FDEA66B|nr:LCP family protein [Nocardioides insulae]